jgi:hypothetical protein
MNIASVVKNTTKFVSDNSPVILTGIAAGGVITTAILAARGGGPAFRDIHNAELDKGSSLTFVEKTKVSWKYYVPAGLVAGGTLVALVAAHTTSSNRVAAAMGAYSILENSYREFREKAVEIHGANKIARVDSEVTDDRIRNNPPSEHNTTVVVAGDDEQLFYDKPHDRYFKSTVNEVERAVNEVNKICLWEQYVSQNDFYRALGIPTVSHGDDFGWKSNSTNGMLDIKYDTKMTPEQKSCITIDYDTVPLNNLFH